MFVYFFLFFLFLCLVAFLLFKLKSPKSGRKAREEGLSFFARNNGLAKRSWSRASGRYKDREVVVRIDGGTENNSTAFTMYYEGSPVNEKPVFGRPMIRCVGRCFLGGGKLNGAIPEFSGSFATHVHSLSVSFAEQIFDIDLQKALLDLGKIDKRTSPLHSLYWFLLVVYPPFGNERGMVVIHPSSKAFDPEFGKKALDVLSMVCDRAENVRVS